MNNSENNDAVRQTQVDSLREMLENMAQELTPRYEGNLAVLRYEPGRFTSRMLFLDDDPCLYVAEERPSRRFLGIFPRTERRWIFSANIGFYDESRGKKEMAVYLSDARVMDVAQKYLDQYVREHSVTGVRWRPSLRGNIRF